MSRVAKKPILVSKDINILIKNKNEIVFQKGLIKIKKIFNSNIILTLQKNYILVNVAYHSIKNWAYAGTVRSIINNFIIGLNKGYKKELILVGIGYKAVVQHNNVLSLNLGFSHTIYLNIPKNIRVLCPNVNEIIVSGYDKELVGQFSAYIRSFKPPESYKKGKGIRYLNENVRIKESKKKLTK